MCSKCVSFFFGFSPQTVGYKPSLSRILVLDFYKKVLNLLQCKQSKANIDKDLLNVVVFN